MRRRRYRRRRLRRLLFLLVTVILFCMLCFSCGRLVFSGDEPNEPSSGVTDAAPTGSTTAATTTTTYPTATTTNPFADTAFSQVPLYSENVFVYDTAAQLMYYKGDMNARIYPASITKLYSAYVALKYLDPTEVVQAGDELSLVQPGSSLAFVGVGHRLTVEMLVEGMMLPSGNDAAYVLAAAAGRKILGGSGSAIDAVSAFVEAMNSHAKLAGLTRTHFANPDGFHDDDHYTTMADLVRISQMVLGCDTIMKYTRLLGEKVYFESGEHCTWQNTNLLLYPDTEYYRNTVLGLKTGHTDQAGYCLISAASMGDSTLLVGVFGADEHLHRFADSVALIDTAKKLLR